MTYSQLFANAGQPMPAQFTQFANVEIPADQLPAYLQQYPPVAQPQAPAAPAPAAVPPAAVVPPAPAMPGAPVAAAAPAANTTRQTTSTSNYEDVYGSWPTIDMVKADFDAEFTFNVDAQGNIQTVPDYRYPELRKEVAYLICRQDPITGTKFPADSPLRIPCYPEAVSRVNGRPTAFRSIKECSHIKLQQNGRLHGYIGMLHKGDGNAAPAGFTTVKASYSKPAPFNWAAIAETTDAVD